MIFNEIENWNFFKFVVKVDGVYYDVLVRDWLSKCNKVFECSYLLLRVLLSRLL